MGALSRLLTAGLGLLRRHPWLLPLASFAAGWLGFVLVSRGEATARWVAALALAGWFWLLAENLLGLGLSRLSRGRLSPQLTRWVTQAVQQELLFFALAFVLGALNPDPGQLIFAALVMAAALASTVDPLYWRMTSSAAGAVAFHACCTFVSGWVVLPIVLHLPLEQALPVALWLTGALLLLSCPRLILGTRPYRWVLHLALISAGLGLIWLLRAHLPAAGLLVKQAYVSQTPHTEHTPATRYTQATALTQGITAFAAIRAPMGLSQPVVFEWWHGQERLDHIPTAIEGGREAGYRTYSRKQNFPADPRGDWRVEIRTPSGQLIRRLVFEITD